MKKREFLKTITTAAVGIPLFSIPKADWMANLPHGSESGDFWEKVRADYDLKPDYINLESGYYNVMPKPVLQAMKEHVETVNREGSYYMRTIQWENKKRMTEMLAETVGCNAANLIITRNTTESLDMIIKGFGWKPGDEAVFAEQDYGAMQDMFHQVSARYGINLKKISVPNHPASDEEIVQIYANAITPRTRLLMICHMINLTGQILPVRKITAMAHSRGVQVMVDGAHCPGHIDFRIDELDCDYYGASLHKWLCAPLGTGMLYVKEEHIDNIWPLLAESKRPPGDISRLNHTGTHPVYHDLTIESAIYYYRKLGPVRKEERLRFLQRYWTDRLRAKKNVVMNTPEDPERSCAIANVGVKGMKPSEMAGLLLKDYGIWTVAIDTPSIKGCRITPNVFTTTVELDALVKAITELAKA